MDPFILLPMCSFSERSVKKVCIWPVWSDSEIEKQEQGVSGKGREKKLSHTPPVS